MTLEERVDFLEQENMLMRTILGDLITYCEQDDNYRGQTRKKKINWKQTVLEYHLIGTLQIKKELIKEKEVNNEQD